MIPDDRAVRARALAEELLTKMMDMEIARLTEEFTVICDRHLQAALETRAKDDILERLHSDPGARRLFQAILADVLSQE